VKPTPDLRDHGGERQEVCPACTSYALDSIKIETPPSSTPELDQLKGEFPEGLFTRFPKPQWRICGLK